MEPVLASLAVATGFTSRAFIPLFVAAVLMRFGPETWLVSELGLMQTLGMPGATPPWFTHTIALVVLGLLSCLEIASTKNADARAVFEEITKYIKPIMALLTVAGIMAVDDQVFAEQIAPPDAAEAGLGGLGFAFAIAAGVYALVRLRSSMISTVFGFDAGDATGLQKVLAWLEDATSALGILIAVLFPILMLLLAGIAVLVLVLLRRFFEQREAARRVPCEVCAASVYSAALKCPECAHVRSGVCAVNLLGVASNRPARFDHDMHLRSFRRCPACAERVPGGGADTKPCAECGTELFATDETSAAYDRWVRLRVGPGLLITWLVGLLPVVGMIPAVLYSRTMLVSPYARYLPRGRAILAKVLLRGFFLVTIAFQFVPLIGAFGIPLSALASHTVYRRVFLKYGPRG